MFFKNLNVFIPANIIFTLTMYNRAEATALIAL
jgi:hypothetical protein